PHIHPRSLHDALPIFPVSMQVEAALEAHPEGSLSAIRLGGPEDSTRVMFDVDGLGESVRSSVFVDPYTAEVLGTLEVYGNSGARSEEHTSELQSRENL